MANLFKTFNNLRLHFLGNPLTRNNVTAGMVRFARYQLAFRLAGAPIVYQWIGNSRLIIGKGMRGVTGDAYMFLDEPRDMLFCAHLLRPGDTFLDVGSNVGSYSVIASKICGAKSIAIEPIAKTVEQLRDNVRLNDIEGLVTVLQLGVSDHEGILRFTASENALNRVARADDKDVTEISVRRLDDIMAAEPDPIFIKVDVENHERQVVSGAQQLLSRPGVKAITLETAEEVRTPEFVGMMRAFGFDAFDYDPKKRELTRTGKPDLHNTLFLRDVEFVQERLRAAKPLLVAGALY